MMFAVLLCKLLQIYDDQYDAFVDRWSIWLNTYVFLGFGNRLKGYTLKETPAGLGQTPVTNGSHGPSSHISAGLPPTRKTWSLLKAKACGCDTDGQKKPQGMRVRKIYTTTVIFVVVPYLAAGVPSYDSSEGFCPTLTREESNFSLANFGPQKIWIQEPSRTSCERYKPHQTSMFLRRVHGYFCVEPI